MGFEAMRVSLTDRYVKALKTDAGRLEVSDAGCRGLGIRCTKAGVKTWTFAYKANGAMRRITLGEYPDLGLKEAREEADERRKLRNAGDDPRAAQTRERAQAAMTFTDLCDKYIEDAKTRKASWKNDEERLKRLKAKFGNRALLSIAKREILDFLEMLARSSKSGANRTQSVLRTMWGWAAERDYLPANFLAGVKRVGGKETEKDRVLTEDELRTFFSFLDDENLKPTRPVAIALKLILLTAQRPGEVARMMLSELHDLNGGNPHWIIPRERTKNRKAEHTVPLSAAAVALIHEALELGKDAGGKETRGNDAPVFAGRFDDATTLARHTLSQAVRRIVLDPEVVKSGKLASFTPHDLRRTAATIVQAARLPIDFVKALLNHHDKGVTGVYARWHMFEEKREAVNAIEAAVPV
jgi:integrase